jgi:hypothetical protein
MYSTSFTFPSVHGFNLAQKTMKLLVSCTNDIPIDSDKNIGFCAYQKIVKNLIARKEKPERFFGGIGMPA